MRLLKLGLAVIFVASCGDEKAVGTPGGAFDPYEDENVTVIGGTGDTAAGDNRITVSSPTGDGECVQVAENLCVPSDSTGAWCERQGGPVDIIVVDGEVVDVICYPPPGNNDKPEEIIDSEHSGNINVLQTSTLTAVTFDESTNGIPIEGDIDIQGNSVSVYGNGPDNTIIDGNVSISGNKVRLRGLTITGDLTINLNNASVILCRVLGNVILATPATNGSIFVENDVFGTFSSNSNVNTIVGNDVQGAWAVTGNGNLCDSDYAFVDANADELVQDSERGDLLLCP